MKVLIAEDDAVSRRVLEATLRKWDYDVIVTEDGDEAWRVLDEGCDAKLLVLDWMMPGLDGTEICRRLRERDDGGSFYVLLLTARMQKDDIVLGLQAGADDYITKPFHAEELRARVRTGARIVQLRRSLATRIEELERALTEVKQLSGLLPICAYCKRIREGESYWQAVENFIAGHSEAQFSHSVCPDCFERVVRPQLEGLPEDGED
ncbi:MAG: response regulator transcription factor [Planctomycetes bacterium]|nr:response regulator transcription factor [Planctomycetota bacterium]